MHRFTPLPWLTLALLTVLAVGAIALGLKEAPPTADLAVHNGAGEIMNLTSFTAVYTSEPQRETIRAELSPSGVARESLLAPNGSVIRSVTAKGARAREIFQPFSQILDVDGFVPRGTGFVAVELASSLVPRREAHDVSGIVRYKAVLRGGYLVDLTETFHVTTLAGTDHGTYKYSVVSVNGQPAP